MRGMVLWTLKRSYKGYGEHELEENDYLNDETLVIMFRLVPTLILEILTAAAAAATQLVVMASVPRLDHMLQLLQKELAALGPMERQQQDL